MPTTHEYEPCFNCYKAIAYKQFKVEHFKNKHDGLNSFPV